MLKRFAARYTLVRRKRFRFNSRRILKAIWLVATKASQSVRAQLARHCVWRIVHLAIVRLRSGVRRARAPPVLVLRLRLL